MKILWISNIFLHPTTKGGQIRTLETLLRLHRRHEIHYVAFEDPNEPEGKARAGEYCTRAYSVPRRDAPRASVRFLAEALRNLFSGAPLMMARQRSGEMRACIRGLLERERFDCMVCDFLTPSINIGGLRGWVLFQHNVESIIYRRYVENARFLKRWYFEMQGRRLFEYERAACTAAGRVVAVSPVDAAKMREMFGVERVAVVPTGVDVDHFAPPPGVAASQEIVFAGSMDWMPNIDGLRYFVKEILPRIRERRPQCSVVIAGRRPTAGVLELAAQDPLIRVTGTVPDIRPYLWGARISIVPLRIGGGTRLKIYEAMAAGVPVVSTSIGAEGLDVRDGEHIAIADTPAAFADACLNLLESEESRTRMAGAARRLVNERFSWERVVRSFEEVLESA